MTCVFAYVLVCIRAQAKKEWILVCALIYINFYVCVCGHRLTTFKLLHSTIHNFESSPFIMSRLACQSASMVHKASFFYNYGEDLFFNFFNFL